MASFYIFKRNLKFKALLETAFDLVAGHSHDGTNSRAIAGASLPAVAKVHVLSVPVETLAAGVDIATRCVFEVPAGYTATLTDARIIPQGSAVGVDDANTCVVTILNATNAIAAATYSTANAMPAVNVSGSLGALNATHKVIAAGGKLHFTVTNGATANPPAMVLQVAYTLASV